MDDEEAGRELTMAKLASIREELLQVRAFNWVGAILTTEEPNVGSSQLFKVL